VRTLFVRHPFQVAEDAPIVQSMVSRRKKYWGGAAVRGYGGWADTSLFERAGMDALIFGPGGDGAHAAVEYADLDSMVTAAQIFAGTIMDFCGLEKRD